MRGSFIRMFILLCSALSLQQCVSSQVRITMRVVTPGDTPESVQVFIAGNLAVLGSWRPDGLPLTQAEKGVWEAEFFARRGERIEFKVTLGTWDTEALYDVSVVPQNTVLVAATDTTVLMRPVSWRHLGFSRQGGITGTVRYHRNLRGAHLRYDRDLIVWLPPSYDVETDKRYPVLYMHDGQNIMDPGTSFLGLDWRVDEVADSLIRQGSMREVIIVGCSNTPDRRFEYSDTKLGRAYAAFVADRVKPMIDSLYRTLPDREHTAVMGSSMGGLISFLFLWWYPDEFSMAGCFSSAFEYGGDALFDEIESTAHLPQDMKIYLDCGTADLDAELLPGYERMKRLLLSKGMVEGVNLVGVIDQGATHNEGAWAARVWRPLTFFFGVKD